MEHSNEKQSHPHRSINDVLPMYSVFIFILLIAAGEIMNIFPCSFIEVIENNIYLKHFIGFLTMTFFVVLIVPIPDKKLNNILSKSLMMYIIFILITKTEPRFSIPIIVLLGITYLLVLKKVEYREEIEKNVNIQHKKDILDKINTIVLINNSILILIAVLLITGFILYLGRKKYEYGADFNYVTFILGRNVCNKTLSTITYNKALEHLFD